MKRILNFFSFFVLFNIVMSCSLYGDYIDEFYDETGEITVSVYANNIKKHQSAAIYGNYVFFVTNFRTTIYVYNIVDRQFADSIPLPAGKGKDNYGGVLYHSNQTSFSTKFYTNEDKFPLMYISQRAKNDLRCFTEVYRIKVENNDEKEKYSAELIQTLYFPIMSESNSLGNTNVVFDEENNLMYTYSRNNDTSASNYGLCKVSCFEIPKTDSSNIYLEDEDILFSFYIDCSAVNMQGACIDSGLLYIGQGTNTPALRIVDLNKRTLVSTYDLRKRTHSFEPQGCFWYDGCLMLCSANQIYKIKFKK